MDHTRIWINAGSQMGIQPGDVIGIVLGETGVSNNAVATVDIRERHLFVDVATEHVETILAKLRHVRFKGHRLKAKVA